MHFLTLSSEILRISCGIPEVGSHVLTLAAPLPSVVELFDQIALRVDRKYNQDMHVQDRPKVAKS